MLRRLKVYMIIFVMIICISCIFLFPHECNQSIQNSLLLCYKVLIPALLPFLVISSIWLDLQTSIGMTGDLSLLILSWICGYPVGTRMVCSAYQQGSLHRNHASALLACTANASPPFLLFAISFHLFGNARMGVCLLLAQTTVSMLLYLFLHSKTTVSSTQKMTDFSFISSLCDGVKSAAFTMLQICAFTVIFGLICDGVLHLPFVRSAPKIITSLIAGGIEIMHGVTILPRFNNPSFEMILILGTMVGFSGFCVWAQSCYFIVKTDLPLSRFVFGKILYSLSMPIFSLIYYSLSVISLPPSKAVSVSNDTGITNIPSFYMTLFAAILLFVLTSVIKSGIMTKMYKNRKGAVR